MFKEKKKKKKVEILSTIMYLVEDVYFSFCIASIPINKQTSKKKINTLRVGLCIDISIHTCSGLCCPRD